jgi:hypothetical protein
MKNIVSTMTLLILFVAFVAPNAIASDNASHATSATSGLVVFSVASPWSDSAVLVRGQPIRNTARVACSCVRGVAKVPVVAAKATVKTAVKATATVTKAATKVATAPVRVIIRSCR